MDRFGENSIVADGAITVISIQAHCQLPGFLQSHLVEINIAGLQPFLFEILNSLKLGLPDGQLIFLMELVNDEPGGDRSRVGVHVAHKQRPTHWQYLDNPQRAQPIKVMPHPNQIIPVLVCPFFLRLIPELSEKD